MKALLGLAALALFATPAVAQLGTPISLGPFGGNLLAVDVDPVAPQTLLVSTWQDGLLRSTNGGNAFASFQPVGLPVGFGLFVARFLRNPNDIGELIALAGTGVYRSTDGGFNWTQSLVPATNDLRWAAVQPGGDVWLASTNAEVWRSDDDAASWSLVFNGSSLGQLVFAPSDPTRAYLASFNGLRVSTDAGATFNAAGAATTWLKGVAVAPGDANTVFAGGLQGRIKKSTNGGLTWSDTLLGTSSSIEFFEWDTFIPGRLWAGLLDRLYITDNQGASWTFASQGLPPSQPIVTDLAFGSNGTQYLSTEDGFFRATGGVPPWVLIGVPSVSMFDAAIAAPGGKRLATNNRGVFASAGPFAPMQPTGWVFDFGAHTNKVVVDPNNPDRWILGGVGAFFDNATVRIATNNGATIQTPLESFGAGQVRGLALDPIGSTQMLAGMYPADFGQPGLARSTDLGAAWIPVAGSAGWATTAIAYDPFTAGRVLALQGLTGNIRESSDGGLTWSVLPGWSIGGTPWMLLADPVQPGVFYGADDGAGLQRSLDGGVTWSTLVESSNERSDIAFHPSIPGLFWFSNGDGRVRVTTDGGSTFANAFTASPAGVLAAGLDLDRSTGGLLIATLGSSAWELFGASPYIDLGGASVGAGAFTPRHFPSGPLAQLGNGGWVLEVDRLVGGAPLILHLGLSNLGLPLAGGVLGTGEPTVLALSAVAGGAPGAPGAGSFAVGLPIPSVPSLAGLDLFTQVFAFDAASPFFVVLSNGLRTKILP